MLGTNVCATCNWKRKEKKEKKGSSSTSKLCFCTFHHWSSEARMKIYKACRVMWSSELILFSHTHALKLRINQKRSPLPSLPKVFFFILSFCSNIPHVPNISLRLYHLLPLFIISLDNHVESSSHPPFALSPGFPNVFYKPPVTEPNGLQQQSW